MGDLEFIIDDAVQDTIDSLDSMIADEAEHMVDSYFMDQIEEYAEKHGLDEDEVRDDVVQAVQDKISVEWC